MAVKTVRGPLKVMAHDVVTSEGHHYMHIAEIDETGKVTLRPFDGEEGGVEFFNGRVVLEPGRGPSVTLRFESL